MEKRKYPEGIYFDMPEEEYHSLNYLNQSSVKHMLMDETGEEYLYHLNNNDKETTKAMELGKAFHCAILEPKRFKNIYTTAPTKEDFEGKEILDKNEELKFFLKSVGEPVSGNKDVLISRCRESIDNEKHVIWQDVIEDFESTAIGKIILPYDDMEKIIGMMKNLAYQTNICKNFNNCKNEVTILWRENILFKGKTVSIPCKARLDALSPQGIIDPKTFATKNGNSITRTIENAIKYMQYDLQYYAYSLAVERIRDKLLAGAVKAYGDVDEQWLEDFKNSKTTSFTFIFVRSQAPYQVESRLLSDRFAEGAEANIYHVLAQKKWDQGLEYFAELIARGFKLPIKDDFVMDDDDFGYQYRD